MKILSPVLSSWFSVFVGLLFIAIAALPNSIIPSAHSQGVKADAETLRQLEADFMKATADKGSKGYMSFYAEDAAELPNGADMLQGKETIAKTMAFLDDKNNHLTWTPVHSDIAASGDLGYTFGTYEFRYKDKDGKLVVENGKYASVWKKQSNGNWKVVMDMGNSSPGVKP